ncbi:poly(A) RNA polymerase, mitochondrial-like [Centruroides vittatus]|uniref:poly(A) RNA polymerase, mitochondrial-like n=1 Tax=Centruroides vittatus TaxID=120091 RepID=UPI0035105B60
MNLKMHKCWRNLWNCTVYGRCNASKSHRYKHIELWNHVQKFMCSSLSTESPELLHSEGKSYNNMLLEHRQRARSSIMVEVKSYYSLFYLCQQIEKFTKPKKILYQKTSSEKEYFLIECENPTHMRLLLDECKYLQTEAIPVYSRILKFNNRSVDKENSLAIPCDISSAPSVNIITKTLLDANDITHQMLELKRCEQLSELDIRLRFFVCSLIEDCISGLFPHALCLPFGSAVNGFGCYSGDLDINLQLCDEQRETKTPLCFLPKPMLTNDRAQLQRTLETFADLLQIFVPGVSHMVRILKARVPILKFQHEITGIWCDLSMSNKNAIDMAEFLFTYGELDPHVRPLVYTIRRWASRCKLTSDVPNAQITNFSLLLMVIFFLQKHSQLHLPSMNQLKSLIEKKNSSEDPNTDHFKISKSDPCNLDTLLKEFFAYYATFDFKKNALSLLKGQITSKPDYSSLYIHNPIELGLNVSKNVSSEELNNLTEAMGSALWQLEKSDGTKQSEPWGILKLFDAQNKSRYWQEWEKKFQIKTLFNKQNANSSKDNSKTKADPFIYEVESNFVNNLSEKQGKKLKKRK